MAAIEHDFGVLIHGLYIYRELRLLELAFGHQNLDFVYVLMKKSYNGQLVTIWSCLSRKLSEWYKGN